MFNKNDPLIGSVKQVMAENQVRRDVEKQLNEEFGIHSKKALPFEHHAEYNALLEQRIAEALHPNQQKLDVHEPEKDELTKQDFVKLRAMKKKTVKEEGEETREGGAVKYNGKTVVSPTAHKAEPEGPSKSDRDALTAKIKGIMKEAAQLDEKAVSKAQQRFFGLVRGIQKGEAKGSEKAEKAAKEMSTKEVRKYAKTKQKGLPEKVDEDFNLDAVMEEIRANLGEEKFAALMAEADNDQSKQDGGSFIRNLFGLGPTGRNAPTPPAATPRSAAGQVVPTPKDVQQGPADTSKTPGAIAITRPGEAGAPDRPVIATPTTKPGGGITQADRDRRQDVIDKDIRGGLQPVSPITGKREPIPSQQPSPRPTPAPSMSARSEIAASKEAGVPDTRTDIRAPITAPKGEGAVGKALASTGVSRAERRSQEFVDKELGAGKFKAGSAEANIALQKKFQSQKDTAMAREKASTYTAPTPPPRPAGLRESLETTIKKVLKG